MKIEWNKVTSFSQIVAIILFVAVFGAGFLIGRKFENKFILGTPVANAKFVCADNKVIFADFYERMVHLEFPGDKVLYLSQTMSASGARYANKGESIVFWNKGDTAFVEQDGKISISDCVVKK